MMLFELASEHENNKLAHWMYIISAEGAICWRHLLVILCDRAP